MADEIVWVSRAPKDSTLIKGFASDILIADRKRTIDAMERNEAGEALPPERFPKEMYRDLGERARKLPDLANAGGFWTVGVPLRPENPARGRVLLPELRRAEAGLPARMLPAG
jgi:hypothetical protein